MFSLEHETDSHYTIKHPRGDVLRIAKRGLSPTLHAHIKKFAKGGQAQAPLPSLEQNPISQGFTNATGASGIKQGLQNIKNYNKGTVDEPVQEEDSVDGQSPVESQKPVTININAGQPANSEPQRQIASEPQIDPALLQRIRAQQTQSRPGQTTLSDIWNTVSAKPQVPPGGVPFSSKFANADEWQAYNNAAQGQQPGAATQAVKESPANFQNVALSGPPTNESKNSSPPPASQDNYANQLQQDINLFRKGTAQQTEAETEIAQKALPRYEEQAKALQDVQQSYQQHLKSYDENATKIANEINSKELDFNKMWHDKGTGSKIMAGLGMLVSGLGSGLTGQPNMALKIINDQIERDIESQKANFGRKRTALEAYSKITGDIGRGADQLRLGYDAAIAAYLKQLSAGSADKLGQARANVALAQFLPAMQERQHSAALQQAMLDQVNRTQGQPEQMESYLGMLDMLNPQMAKEKRSMYLPQIGAMASRPVSEKDNSEITKRIDVDQKWKALEDFAREHGGTLPTSAHNIGIINRGKQMAKSLTQAYREGEGLGVYREGTAKFENELIPQDPTAFMSGLRTLNKYEVLRNDNFSSLKNKLENYGVKKIPMQVAGSRLTPRAEVTNVANRTR